MPSQVIIVNRPLLLLNPNQLNQSCFIFGMNCNRSWWRRRINHFRRQYIIEVFDFINVIGFIPYVITLAWRA